MAATDGTAINSCRCGCGGTSRGLFVPGHDARYKSELARRLHEATRDDEDRERYDAVRDECDAIDSEYGRPAGKWWSLVTKQAENLRLNAAKQTAREARGTPLQRAARRTGRMSTVDPGAEDGPSASELRAEYVQELIDRLAHTPLTGQVGTATVDGQRCAVRVWQTRRDQGESAIAVRVIDTGEIHQIPADSFHRDVTLEHAH